MALFVVHTNLFPYVVTLPIFLPPPPSTSDLPIHAVLPALYEALADRSAAVVQAPPGAGKTTVVPLALRDAPWLQDLKLLVLEPRRLAARAAAHRMADLLGEPVGATVGYRMRMDTRVGPDTQIEVVTEGVLTRMLQTDPLLTGVGAVLFDEFHERSVQADLGLALCLDVQQAVREDLRLVVMSATLDAEPVAALLGDAPLLTSEGRTFPVETHYADAPLGDRIAPDVARAVRQALAETEGDVLVFLPGAGEIRRVERLLGEHGLPARVTVHPLFGMLPFDRQDAAIRPSPPGARKIVLATSIAETSLTIEGIRVVVDSGLARVPRFDAQRGMARLATVPASKASADQRRGRAGRVAAGVCYRLWTRHAHGHRPAFLPPEIEHADLAPVALELAAWGAAGPDALRWLSPPPDAPFEQAQALLHALGALDAEGRITSHGRAMAELAAHPRIAHMLLAAPPALQPVACDLAALLSDRDILRGTGRPADADVRLRLEVLHAARTRQAPPEVGLYGAQVDRGAVRHVLRSADTWRRKLRVRKAPSGPAAAASTGVLVALAYPDRVAQRLPGDAARFRLRHGPLAAFTYPQLLADAPFLAVADLDGRRRQSRIFLAAPLDEADLRAQFGEAIATRQVIRWDDDARRVVAREQEVLDALVLKDGPLAAPDPSAVMQAMVDGIRTHGLDLLPWSKAAWRLRERLAFLHRLDATWPDVSDEALLATLETWLGPHLYGLRRADDLARLDLTALLQQQLDWQQHERLDAWAPTHLVVPSGSRIPLDYSDPEAPVLAVRLQEVFGLTETPHIAGGRVPLTIHLLSPAHRPVQITQDLASFWREAYFDVRNDLRGRYAKHYWPEDPLSATPTSRAKPRR